MRKLLAITATLAILVGLIRPLGPLVQPIQAVSGSGPNLTVNYLSGTDATGSWGDSTPAAIGETVEFYIEVRNTNVPSTAKNLTVSVNLPATPNGGVITSLARAKTTTPTTVSGAQTDVTDSTQVINLPTNALLQYQSGSLRVSADLDGDGTKEYDNFAWGNDNITTNGVNLGSLKGSSGADAYVQISFKAKVIEGGAPNLTVKHLSANSAHPADGWQETATAAPGDALQFYIEVHNTNVPSVAKDLTVRVDLPNGEGDSLTSLATADAANAAAVAGGTTVNFSAPAKWHVRSLSTRITWDSNGDGVLDMNGYIWPNDDLFSSQGLNLGEQWGCNPFIIQISFWVDTEAVPTEEQPSGPQISIEKKVIFNGQEYDSVARDTHLYDAGEEVEYKLTVKNSGEQEATGVKVIDQLPAYIRTLDGQESKEFNIGTLVGGGEWSTNYTARVVANLPQNDRTQQNTARVETDNAGSDSDSAFIWINGPEILAAQAEAAATAEELPVTGPGVPVAAGLSALLPIGWYLRRRLV